MKKRISTCVVCCALIMALVSGCSNYDDINAALDSITIQNILPKVEEDASYQSLESVEDLVYEQQLAACVMYADTYNQTYYQQFIDDGRKEGKIANICADKRKSINTDIEIAFAINVYRLLQDVRDCSNIDAYVVKTHKDVLDFYDVYDKYLNSEDQDDALIALLLDYNERSNILAFKFLDEKRTDVFETTLARIEDNAATDDNFRFKINQNNAIITALNSVYGGVPEKYAEKIAELNNELAKKLLMSLESVSDEDREKLLEQLNPSTPTPEPTSSALPLQSLPPEVTPGPLATRIPATAATATSRPTATPTPRPTASPTPRPTATPTPRPVPTAAPTATPTAAPTEEPYEPIFGADDPTYDDSNEITFE